MIPLLSAIALILLIPAVVLILAGPRAGAFIAMAAALTVVLIVQRSAGLPTAADGRLSAEPWHVLAVASLEGDVFLISVRYAAGDIRSYTLHIADPTARDEFLKAIQGLKKGHSLLGKAGHGRAGLTNDGEMEFSFRDVPESEPKAAH